jgi:gliding motility-associated-like protein
MKKIFTLLLVVLCLQAIGQVTISTPEQYICEGETVTLDATLTGATTASDTYTIVDIPYTPEAFAGTLVTMWDDSEQGPFDIGFDFCFFGNTYDEFYLGSNGWITFSAAQPTGYVSGAIPDPASPVNSIMGPWSDWNPGTGGEIRYQTVGTAPNRSLVVSWIDVPLYGGLCTSYTGTFQIVLRESTNFIDNYLDEKPNCPDDGAGGSNIAVQGIQNIDGTVAFVVPGRNATAWTADDEGKRFEPDGIPGIQWSDGTGVIGFGPSISVTPTITTTYTAFADACTAISLQDEVIVNVSPTMTVIPTITNNMCPGDNLASIELLVTGGVSPDFDWTSTNSYTSTSEDIYVLAEGDYSVTITDAYDCEISAGSFSINATPLPIQVTEATDPVSCYGFSDGTITTSTVGGTAGYTYNWSSVNTFTDNGASITDLASGDYTLNLTDNNGCLFTTTYFLAENSTLNVDSNTSNYNGFNIRCYEGSDGWISVGISGGMLPYIYSWTNGLGDVISDYSDIHDVRAGDYQLTVTDAEGCPVVLDFALTQPDSLSIDVSNFQHKSCTYNDDGFIEIVTWGGPDTPPGSENFNPFTFRWDGPNFFFSYEEDIYNLENGMYHLTTRDINDCENTLSFEITEPPMVIADYHVMDDTVTINYPYMNIYDNSEGNIVTWDWEISNGFTSSAQDILELNLATNLEDIGIKEYALKLIVTDEFGCSDTTHGTLAIKDEHTLYVPNAFTPDLDMNNDEFIIRYHALQEETFKLDIYDRFGSLVHTSNDPNSSWDGTNDFSGNKLMTGVYTYYISYQDFEGRIYDHTTCENCTGTISLMR